MSISNISTQAAGHVHRPSLSHLLSSALSRLDNSSDQPSAAASVLDTITSTGEGSCGPGTTGSSTTQLSDGILNLLFQMQQQTSATADSGSTATDATSAQSPVQRFLAALDTDGDSQISQSEFETYLAKNGATKEQADKIFGAVDTDGSGSISSDELTQAVQNGQSRGGRPSPADIANRLFSKVDADGDGSVTQAELETFVTENGGTTDEADKVFAALDPNSDGSVTKDQFTQTLAELLPAKPVPRHEKDGVRSSSTSSTSATASGKDKSAWLRLLDALAANAASSNTAASSSVAIAA